MAEIDKEFELRYVRAKSLSDSKDISLALTACNELIEAAQADSHLLDKDEIFHSFQSRLDLPGKSL